jgi:HK97 family phage portal protein
MRPAVLSGGMKLEALSFSPESMALLSLREFDEQRIAAAFGVPPFFVGLPQPGGLNYTSTAMLADLFYRQTLRPMAKNIADAVSGWALPRGTNLVFDASEYTTPDQATLLAAYAQVAGAVPGSILPDDVRRAAGLPLNPDAPTPAPMGVTA